MLYYTRIKSSRPDARWGSWSPTSPSFVPPGLVEILSLDRVAYIPTSIVIKYEDGSQAEYSKEPYDD